MLLLTSIHRYRHKVCVDTGNDVKYNTMAAVIAADDVTTRLNVLSLDTNSQHSSAHTSVAGYEDVQQALRELIGVCGNPTHRYPRFRTPHCGTHHLHPQHGLNCTSKKQPNLESSGHVVCCCMVPLAVASHFSFDTLPVHAMPSCTPSPPPPLPVL